MRLVVEFAIVKISNLDKFNKVGTLLIEKIETLRMEWNGLSLGIIEIPCDSQSIHTIDTN